MDKYSVLANLLINIWENHDRRSLKKTESSIKNLFRKLKIYNPKVTKQIAKAYFIHAKIDDLVKKTDNEQDIRYKIKKYDLQTRKQLELPLKQLGVQNYKQVAKHHSCWWYNFLLRNHTNNPKFYLFISWHILLEHYYMLGKIIPTILCSIFLIIGGKYGHKRDNHLGEKALTLYWKHLLKNKNVVMF
jgi:hypothetical protein